MKINSIERRMFKINVLEDFAVIKTINDTIELNDLTVFMGDNSAGKSYLAMLIHAFITMTRGYDDPDFLKAVLSKFKSTHLVKYLNTSIGNILSIDNKKLLITFEEEDLKDLKDIIYFSVNDYLVKKYLVDKLFKSNNLKKIEIELNQLVKRLPKKLSISHEKKDSNTLITIIIDKKTAILDFQGEVPGDNIKRQILEIVISLLVESTIKGTLPVDSVYLPASRTGYLQTYKILANKAVVNRYTTSDDNEINQLSIIISFFINQLNSSTDFKENKFAEYIENFIMGGRVNIYKDSSDIDFELSNGNKIDLNLLSSTVSELIPLVVFLKRGLIKRNGLLVIEEPEAHLSFKNQKLIAKLITLLLQNNIKVLITTHSDFLIYELNNLIMKDTLHKNKEHISEDIKELLKDEISLDYRKVSLYNFTLKNENSIIDKVEINKYGINNKYIFDSTYAITDEKNRLLDAMDLIDV